MSVVPQYVEIHEEGPREGFQFEQRLYPLAQRVELVHALADTGLKQIQVASFVHPGKVPQMADSEALFEALEPRPGVRYTGLWLNKRGFDRARTVSHISLMGSLNFYASNAFSLQNNNCSADQMRDAQRGWIDIYRESGVPLETAYIMTAFGCNLEGAIPVERVAALAKWCKAACDEAGVAMPALYLCDTVGWANPLAIRRVVDAVRNAVPGTRIGLHLHDTRGTGAANFLAGLQSGVDLYDSSVAGLGGCPFCGHTSGAAGNVCTEDMVFMCHEMGIETGIDLERLIEAARLAERIFGKTLPGRVLHAGSLAAFA
ncbi:hydroxymethylglutaryl-CoA lyase [Bordetella sp. BOR01]|uniref:hydroxymethylglutaryl-CoA lyase n=1 Tax=Bordetella sp. BOR01 TaxID=2854779 RepID=UPI001C485D60|nr:hydroxymethylglutaryl-CoA lyase [Bordetella sp. BOR01]MBV7482361.1 hydroxymethylglutaryl-CoA lyase [Bordetella sp. BOR01]